MEKPKEIRHEYEWKKGDETIKETIVAEKPSRSLFIDAISERELRRYVFSSTEMGRRYWEQLQAILDTKKETSEEATSEIGIRLDIAKLEAEASYIDRNSFTRMISWGIEETMQCVKSVEGADCNGDAADWLLANRKQALMDLRGILFGEPK